MITGVVEAINLTDGADEVNTIWVSVTKGGRRLVKCSPLNMNIRHIPVLGELVYLVKASSDAGSGIGNGDKYYYTSTVGVHKNINNNVIPNYNDWNGSGGGGGEYASVSAGVPNSNSSTPTNDFGAGFVELDKLPQLQGYLGDTIFEGRFGQSIRFGYAPKNITKTTNTVSSVQKEPTWSSDVAESPITIIRNGVTTNDGYNKFVVEDINKDASSIWLTDQHTINLKLSNKVTLGVTPVTTYKSPQLILNSDRIVINSKKDSVIISGKKSVNISTKGWKADMDVMFTQIQRLEAQLTALTNALTTTSAAAIAINPAWSAMAGLTTPIISQLSDIKTQLQLMKQ